MTVGGREGRGGALPGPRPPPVPGCQATPAGAARTPPLHLRHVSLLLVQFHSQGRYFLLTEPVSLGVNVLTAPLSSSELFDFSFQF